ncbi:hexose kinase [candidate division GN15 bacterium]|nr:hexose kinase [candidate division GN15 bacterium]
MNDTDQNQARIVTLTMNPSVDVSSGCEHVKPEVKLRCTRPRYEPGGGGINVSRALRKLGRESLACYPVGGPGGTRLQGLLEDEKVASEGIAVEGETRENLTVSEASGDQQYRFTMPGPELSESEQRECVARIWAEGRKPEYVIASGSLPPGVPDDFLGRLTERAQEEGARVIVDTSGEPLKKAVESGVYLIKPNMREVQSLSEKGIEDETELRRLGDELIARCKCQAIVVSLGAGGALLITGDTQRHYKSPTVPIRSKVGAGDSMMAGIVYGLTEGQDIEEAVRYGVAAGAAAVMTPGSELCRREDTLRLLKQVETG